MKLRDTFIVFVMFISITGSNSYASLDYNWVEIFSTNSIYGWDLKTSLGVSGATSTPEYAWSENGSNFSPYRPLGAIYNWTYDGRFYESSISIDSGISPPSTFNGFTFSWIFHSGSEFVQTSGEIYGIRNVGLIQNAQISIMGSNPTITWHNTDDAISKFRIRVFDRSHPSDDALTTIDLLRSQYGDNPVYTFSDFDFITGVDYSIRIEARESLQLFQNVQGVSPELGPGLINRSLTYLYYSPSPVPIPAAAWLLGSGLVGLVGARKKLL